MKFTGTKLVLAGGRKIQLPGFKIAPSQLATPLVVTVVVSSAH
jgi:hypothetical protein